MGNVIYRGFTDTKDKKIDGDKIKKEDCSQSNPLAMRDSHLRNRSSIKNVKYKIQNLGLSEQAPKYTK